MRHNWFLIIGALAILAVGYLNLLALRFSWYWLHWWADLPIHALGAFGLGLILLALGEERVIKTGRGHRREIILGVVGLVMLTSFVWEMFEFTSDRQQGRHFIIRTPAKLQQGTADTATDLLADLAGVLVSTGVFSLILWPRKA